MLQLCLIILSKYQSEVCVFSQTFFKESIFYIIEHSINLLWPLCCFSLQIYWYRQGDVDPKFKKMIYFNSFTTVLLCVCANIYFHFRDDCSWQKWNSFRCLLCRFRMAGFVEKKIQRKMLASASFTTIYPITHLKGTLFIWLWSSLRGKKDFLQGRH